MTEPQRSDEPYRSLIENIPDAVWRVDAEGRTLFVSPSIARLTGVTPEESCAADPGAWFDRVHPDDEEMVRATFAAMLASRGREVLSVEFRLRHPDGRWLWLHSRSTAARVENGELVVDGLTSDITHRKNLEERLLQSEKMEAVGQLAGGVAHDFNNLLAVILANASSLLSDLSPTDPRREEISEIQQAAQRGAGLTRQLLAFSRKSVVRLETFCPNEVLLETRKMLQRLIGEDMTLSFSHAVDLGTIRADRGQVEQAVMNLVVNARDAMPRGGVIHVRTANVDVTDPSSAGIEALPAGEYVEIAVSDDGCGMDEATRKRIFEPFFTTKAAGKGTGLGLATVYGIVKNAGGSVAVESEPGLGSTFRLLFPSARAAFHALPADDHTPLPVFADGECVLFVEDEALVRSAMCRVLRASGLHVLEASNGIEALAVVDAHPEISLVVTDVVMPGQSGPDLIAELRSRKPGARALYMSGYADHPALQAMVADGAEVLLQKPFTTEQLLASVGELLATRNPPAAAVTER